MTDPKAKANGTDRKKKGWRLVLFFLMLLLVFVLTAQIFINKPWGVRFLSDKLSDVLHTEINIDSVHIGLLGGLYASGILIRDHHQDTLIYVQKLETHLGSISNIISQKDLSLSDVHISQGQFYLKTYLGEMENNFQITFNTGATRDAQTERKPLTLELGSVFLKQFVFRHVNENNATFEQYMLNEGQLDVRDLDLKNNLLHLKRIYVDQVSARILMEKVKALTADVNDAPPTQNEDSTSMKQSPFRLVIDDIDLQNGQFELHNYDRTPVWNGNYQRINFDHFKVDQVNLRAADFTMQDLQFSGSDVILSLQSPTGFEVTAMDVSKVDVTDQYTSLSGLNLLTPHSHLQDTLKFKYPAYTSWRNFNNEVFIEGTLRDSYVALRDIMNFAPALYDNTFFMNSENEVIHLNGFVYGRMNSMKARNLNLRLGEDIVFRGNVSTRDLTLRNSEFFGLDIDLLRFDINSLEKIIPQFSLPPNFEKLQAIQYKGRFDGYFLDFVTFGTLKSHLGVAKLDMRLDLKNGKKQATYSGNLDLENFNLGSWSDNEELGGLSLKVGVKKGRGLVVDEAEVNLEGNIQKFEFKNHEYRNITVNGALSKNSFEGLLVSRSDDAKFTFNGAITDLDSFPVYQFRAEVERLSLLNLNITKTAFDFGGKFNVAFRGLNWKELIGQGEISDIWIQLPDRDSLTVESLFISQVNTDNGRRLTLNSNILEASLNGVYSLPDLHKEVAHILQTNHPKMARLIALPTYSYRDSLLHEYHFDIQLKDDKGLIDYFTNKKFDLRRATLNGNVNTPNQSIKLVGEFPQWTMDNTDFYNCHLSILNEKDFLLYDVSTDNIEVNKKSIFTKITSSGNFNGDKGLIKATYVDPLKIVEGVELNAEFYSEEDGLALTLDPAFFKYKKESWRFLPGNKVYFKNKKILFDDFTLSSFRQVLQIDDINDGQGIKVRIQDFSTDFIDSLIYLKGFDFDGRFDAELTIGNLKAMTDIHLELTQDDILLNDESRGALRIVVDGESIAKGLNFDLNIDDGYSALSSKGKVQGDEYEGQIFIRNYPLSILEAVITSGIKNTKGQVSGDVNLKGKKSQFTLLGALQASGETTVDYLATTYSFKDQRVLFEKDFLNFDGVVIHDKDGNSGSVKGGLEHHSFKDWKLDVTIASDRLLMLNTTKSDNPDYYGTAYGKGEVDFFGSIEQPFIYVVGESMSGTSLVIPISYEYGDAHSDFVQFVSLDSLTSDDTTNTRIEGLDLEMKLSITEEANMKIIFDEQAGDILQGTGNGNVTVKLSPDGALSVYGDYEIEEGDYLFTLLNFVNKPFTVERGGKIRWTGDPIDAQINIAAAYKGLTAAPYTLISDIVSGSPEPDAQRPTRVDLTMLLRGSLLRPLIDFNIKMPDLIGNVKTYTENRLANLRNDPNELNKQVFGLVVFGSFLPSSGLGNNFVGSSTVNTLSEFLATQLSFVVSDWINNIVDDVNFISSVDVDLAYIRKLNIDAQTDNFRDGEYLFRVKNRLWNDRWVVTLGGNYGSQSFYSNDPYFNPETIIEWNTPIKGLKLRAYYRGEDSLQGQRQRIGGGIRYRKEFNTFAEFFNQMKKVDKERRDNI